MADSEFLTTGNAVWTAVLSFTLGLMRYLLVKRDERIDRHDADLLASERRHSAFELKVSEHYATKNSMTMLFQEAQRARKEDTDRLQKGIDDTRVEVSKTNTKLDQLGTSILAAIARKDN